MTYAIKNWSRYQHYKERHPPWIKLYHDLLDDDAFGRLDPFSQLLYFKLLMAASRKDNRIPDSVAWMSAELTLPKARIKKALDVLLSTGFLTAETASTTASKPASKPASRNASNGASKNASPSRAPAHSREVEVEVEIETPSFLPAVAKDPERAPAEQAGRRNLLDEDRINPFDLIPKKAQF